MRELYLKFGDSTRLPMATVLVEHKETEAPRCNSATGYGSKIPTRYMIKFDNRWRRVYCAIWSNVGTLYAFIDGEKITVQEY